MSVPAFPANIRARDVLHENVDSLSHAYEARILSGIFSDRSLFHHLEDEREPWVFGCKASRERREVSPGGKPVRSMMESSAVWDSRPTTWRFQWSEGRILLLNILNMLKIHSGSSILRILRILRSGQRGFHEGAPVDHTHPLVKVGWTV
jgi:hypothetical protein